MSIALYPRSLLVIAALTALSACTSGEIPAEQIGTATTPATATVYSTTIATTSVTVTVPETITTTATITRTASPADIALTFPDPPETLSLADGHLFEAAQSFANQWALEAASPELDGPDSHSIPPPPRCPADERYFDEPSEGLRFDVQRAWSIAVTVGAASGITLCLNDGKRSIAQQEEIFQEYVHQYSQETAEELVLPADRSVHVIGLAIDVQPAAAYSWLAQTHGALGFCRMYDNEPWHFEYHPAYTTTGCPAPLPQPPR